MLTAAPYYTAELMPSTCRLLWVSWGMLSIGKYKQFVDFMPQKMQMKKKGETLWISNWVWTVRHTAQDSGLLRLIAITALYSLSVHLVHNTATIPVFSCCCCCCFDAKILSSDAFAEIISYTYIHCCVCTILSWCSFGAVSAKQLHLFLEKEKIQDDARH